MKRPKQEKSELQRANAILKAASAFLRPSSTGQVRGRGVHPRPPRSPRCCLCGRQEPAGGRNPASSTPTGLLNPACLTEPVEQAKPTVVRST